MAGRSRRTSSRSTWRICREPKRGWGLSLFIPIIRARTSGKSVVGAGIEYLKASGAKVIGLETMPRTMDNIGFYSSLGMNPGFLTLTVTVDGAYSQRHVWAS